MIKAKLKQGVNLKDLNPMFFRDQYIIQECFQDFFGVFYSFTITSANDSIHSEKSTHYDGDAIDLRIRDCEFVGKELYSDEWFDDMKTFCRYLSMKLGRHYYLLLEKTHIHLQISNRNLLFSGNFHSKIK